MWKRGAWRRVPPGRRWSVPVLGLLQVGQPYQGAQAPPPVKALRQVAIGQELQQQLGAQLACWRRWCERRPPPPTGPAGQWPRPRRALGGRKAAALRRAGGARRLGRTTRLGEMASEWLRRGRVASDVAVHGPRVVIDAPGTPESDPGSPSLGLLGEAEEGEFLVSEFGHLWQPPGLLQFGGELMPMAVRTQTRRPKADPRGVLRAPPRGRWRGSIRNLPSEFFGQHNRSFTPALWARVARQNRASPGRRRDGLESSA